MLEAVVGIFSLLVEFHSRNRSDIGNSLLVSVMQVSGGSGRWRDMYRSV